LCGFCSFPFLRRVLRIGYAANKYYSLYTPYFTTIQNHRAFRSNKVRLLETTDIMLEEKEAIFITTYKFELSVPSVFLFLFQKLILAREDIE